MPSEKKEIEIVIFVLLPIVLGSASSIVVESMVYLDSKDRLKLCEKTSTDRLEHFVLSENFLASKPTLLPDSDILYGIASNISTPISYLVVQEPTPTPTPTPTPDLDPDLDPDIPIQVSPAPSPSPAPLQNPERGDEELLAILDSDNETNEYNTFGSLIREASLEARFENEPENTEKFTFLVPVNQAFVESGMFLDLREKCEHERVCVDELEEKLVRYHILTEKILKEDGTLVDNLPPFVLTLEGSQLKIDKVGDKKLLLDDRIEITLDYVILTADGHQIIPINSGVLIPPDVELSER